MPRTCWPCSPSHSRRGTMTKEGCPQPMFKDLRNALHKHGNLFTSWFESAHQNSHTERNTLKAFQIEQEWWWNDVYTVQFLPVSWWFFLPQFSWTRSLGVDWGTWLKFSWLSTEQFQPTWSSQESECLKMANWMLNSNAMTFDALFPNSVRNSDFE